MRNDRLKRGKFGSAGFSLTEALIAVAMIGLASAAFSSLLVGMQKGQNNVKFRADADTFAKELRSLLSSTQNCTANFGGKIANNSASYTVTTLKDQSGATVYQTNNKYEFGNVIFNQSVLNSYKASTYAADTGLMTLTTSLSAPQQGAGSQVVPRAMYISVQLSTTDHQTITSCIALAEMTDGIWIRQASLTDNIYFSPPNMNGGHVGIGSDKPVALLTVEGKGTGSILSNTPTVSTPDFPAIRVTNTSTSMGQWSPATATTNNFAFVQTYAGNGAVQGQVGSVYANVPDSTSGAYVVWAKSVQTPIVFETTHNASSTGYTEKMRLTSNGTLAIGTTKPVSGALLDVNGPVAFANQNAVGLANAGLFFKNTSGNMDARVYEGVDNNINFVSGGGGRFKFLGTSKELFDIDSNGFATGWSLSLANEQGLYFQNAGGGNDSRVYEGVGGNLNMFTAGLIKFAAGNGSGQMYFQQNGNLTVSGAVTAQSDRRLKTDIHPIENALEQISDLSGYTYYWKKDAEKKSRQVGVIAQEVQKTLPELVHEMDNPDEKSSLKKILTVDYEHLVAVVISAINELRSLWSADSAALHSEIATLKAQNAALAEKNLTLGAENGKMSERLKKIEDRLDQLEQKDR